MKLSNILKTIAVIASGVFMVACQQKEEDHQAKAVAAAETYLYFESKDAAELEVQVYADGNWAVDVDSEWISVSPMSGSGMGSIKVTVTDNYTGSVEDLPREGTITIQGGSVERNAEITVHQDGDTYKGVTTYTLAQIRELDDDTVAKIESAKVVARSTNGFIVTDASGSLYVEGTGVEVGSTISFNGAKITVNGAPAFKLDEYSLEGASEVVHPTPVDITSTITTLDYTITQYVSLSASLVGTNIWISADLQIPVLDPIDDLELDKYDLHKVVLKGYVVGKSLLVVSVEDGGADEDLIPYPLRFLVRVPEINYTSESWATTQKINPVKGLGYLTYVPYELEKTNDNDKFKLDVSDKSPRVTGPWPGDYWLFYGNGAIKAGSEVHIAFEARTSATGHKFWIIEFLDGEEWRPACETFTTNEPGQTIVYTHAMNADGATNVQIDCNVKYRKNTAHGQFRFRCLANWQASGAGALATRNGGSARLTVTDTADPTYQPVIEITKEGDGVEKDPVYANIEVDKELLTFNGTPGDPKTITVKSDHDFTVSTTADWLSFDVTEGVANEETAIAVTCAESQLSELREAVIRITSEDSEATVNVVQSAAGQMLDPFISVSTGNFFEILATDGKKTLKVQSNVEFEVESNASWLTFEKVETKALVDWTEYEVTYEANPDEAVRIGQVRFFNTENNLESVVTFSQAAKEPEPIYPEGVYFQDDFEWLEPWAAYTVDDVTNNTVGSAPNAFTKAEVADALTLFVSKGYGYVWGWKDQDWSDGTPDNGNKQTLYLMHNYLKFGKTSYNSGIILPKLQGLTGATDVDLTFDWCWCMTGAAKPDLMTLTVTVTGGGTIEATGTEVSGEITSAQPTEGDVTKLEWQHVTVRILGATEDTRITIRPTNTDPSISNSRKQNRWYLDNVKVAKPETPSPKVGDVLWEEWWTGSAAGDVPSGYCVSDAKTTKSYGDAAITYSEGNGGGTTKFYDDGLVYYNDVNNLTDEKYRMNLLVAKNQGFVKAEGIPCKGVKTATFSYRSNYKLEGSHQVTTTIEGVTLGELQTSTTPKLDLDTKNTNTIFCTVTIPEGVTTLDLCITNINSKSNIRIDGIEMVVAEVY